MSETGGTDLGWLSSLPAWTQTFAGIGVTAAVFLATMRAYGVRWNSATLSGPEKTHADEVVERQAEKTNEILQGILEACIATRDANIATRDAVLLMSANMVSSRANQERILTAQEKIAEIMKAQDDKAKSDMQFENQARRLLDELNKREERDERDRAQDHRRPPRRD